MASSRAGRQVPRCRPHRFGRRWQRVGNRTPSITRSVMAYPATRRAVAAVRLGFGNLWGGQLRRAELTDLRLWAHQACGCADRDRSGPGRLIWWRHDLPVAQSARAWSAPALVGGGVLAGLGKGGDAAAAVAAAPGDR